MNEGLFARMSRAPCYADTRLEMTEKERMLFALA